MISWHREGFLPNKNKTAHCGTFCIRLGGVWGIEFPALILMLSTGIALWPLGRNSMTQLSFLLNSSAGCRSQLHGFTWCRRLWSFSPEQHLGHFKTSAIARIHGTRGEKKEEVGGKKFSSCYISAESFLFLSAAFMMILKDTKWFPLFRMK